jgi:hypothetical protein
MDASAPGALMPASDVVDGARSFAAKTGAPKPNSSRY